MHFIEWISQPWPWYVAGPLIGLVVPALLILGNKSFGISASMRHICAACVPANIPFFKYDWKKEIWNLYFIGGILIGAILASLLLSNPQPVQVHETLVKDLHEKGVRVGRALVPPELFNWNALLSAKGLLLMVVGGFLVGFGSRYAGGCTSGHSIMGLSNLQWPSLIATICFMAGGFLVANFFIPHILNL